MGNMERNKGLRIEREIINRHKELGIDAERVPLSGASRYQGGGHDVDVYPWGRRNKKLTFEVKGRASGAGFTMLERWLGDYNGVFLRRDRQEPLVVVTWQTWIDLVNGGGHLIGIQPSPKNGHADATCARPAVSEGTRRGDRNEHLDEA